MIRRQELEKERQRVLLEFAKPAAPSPDAPLIPGIQAPLVSPSAPHSPGDLSSGINHQYNRPPQSTGPPNFDRSLKPGSLFSPGNNSELSFLSLRGLAFWGFKILPYSCFKVFICGNWFLSPWPTLFPINTMSCSKTLHESHFAFSFSLLPFTLPPPLPRYNGGCPSATVRALWAMQELSEVGWGQHEPGRRNLRHLVWQTGKILDQGSSSEPNLYSFSLQWLG